MHQDYCIDLHSSIGDEEQNIKQGQASYEYDRSPQVQANQPSLASIILHPAYLAHIPA